MLEKVHGYTLVNVAEITCCLGIFQADENREKVLAKEGSFFDLHSRLLGHGIQFIRDIMFVSGALLNQPVDSSIEDIGKQFVQWSDDCKTWSAQ